MKKKTVVFRGIVFNKYEIDETGQIWRKGSGQPLKAWDDMRGYLVVEMMSDNNIPIKAKLHLVSAHTFIGPQEFGMVVNHIDGNKHNPAWRNLEYISQRENVAHAQQLIKGKEYLSKERYTDIMNDLENDSVVNVAEKHDVKHWIIRDMKRGRTYTHYR